MCIPQRATIWLRELTSGPYNQGLEAFIPQGLNGLIFQHLLKEKRFRSLRTCMLQFCNPQNIAHRTPHRYIPMPKTYYSKPHHSPRRKLKVILTFFLDPKISWILEQTTTKMYREGHVLVTYEEGAINEEWINGKQIPMSSTSFFPTPE